MNLLDSGGLNPCPDDLGHHSARLSAGGEVQSLFGQCPNRGDAKFKGASLTSDDHKSG